VDVLKYGRNTDKQAKLVSLNQTLGPVKTLPILQFAPRPVTDKYFNLSPDYEASLLGDEGKIKRGALTDFDISYIIERGSREVKNAFEWKVKREKANSEHVKRMYGKDWDNKDNAGNLYKMNDTIDLANPEYSEEQAEKMKIINQENNAS